MVSSRPEPVERQILTASQFKGHLFIQTPTNSGISSVGPVAALSARFGSETVSRGSTEDCKLIRDPLGEFYETQP